MITMAGRVPLLNREGEVRIAKRIEAAEERIQSTMFLLPLAVRDLQLTAEKLKENKDEQEHDFEIIKSLEDIKDLLLQVKETI